MARPPSNPRFRSEVDDIGGPPPGASAPAAPDGGQAVDQEPTGAAMSQAELEARFKEIAPGGDGTKLVAGQETRYRTIPNPTGDPMSPNFQPGQPRTLRVPYVVQTWRNPATGASIEATHQPDGSFLVMKDTGQTRAPRAATPRTPEQQRADAANASKAEADAGDAKRDSDERAWNSAHGYGNVTHAQREAQIRADQTQARADNNQARLTAAQEAANQLGKDRLQFEREQANKPKAGEVVKGAGPNGEDVQAIADPKTGVVSYRPIAGAKPGDEPIPTGFEFAPDYTLPDGGLTAYNERLLEGRRNNQITRDQGLRLLQQAGALWDVTRTHGNDLVGQAETTYGHDLTQRGQDLGEVQSRRSAAGGIFNDAYGHFSSEKIPVGSGGVAADAFMAALNLGQQNAQQWGGLTDVPQVEVPQAIQQTRSIKIGPDGSVHIKTPHEAPPPAPPAPAPAAQNAGQGTGDPPSRGSLPSQPTSAAGAGAAAPAPAAAAPSVAGALYVGPNGEAYTGDGKIWVQSPATGQPGVIGTWDPSKGQPPGTTPLQSAPAAGLPSGRPDQTQAAPQIEDAINPPSTAPAPAPDYGQPGMRVLPQGPTPENPQDIPFNPPPGEPGHNPNAPSGVMPPAIQGTRAQVPQWQPHPNTIAELKAKGFTDAEIQEAMATLPA